MLRQILYLTAEVRGIRVFVEMTMADSYSEEKEHDVFTEVNGQLFVFSRKVKQSEMEQLVPEEE